MLPAAIAVALATDFTFYPSLGDRIAPEFDSVVEAAIDRGPIYELVVRCNPGTAIISYSKVEKLFCTPKRGCLRELAPAVDLACSG
jgi:hypothetical protein